MRNYAGNCAKKTQNPAAYLFWMVSDTTLTCVIEVCEDGDMWVSVCSLFVCVRVSFDSLLDSGTALQRWPNIDCGHFHLNKPFLCVTCPLTSARKIINFSSAHTLVIELTLAALCHRCSFEYTNSETQAPPSLDGLRWKSSVHGRPHRQTQTRALSVCFLSKMGP